MCGAVSREKKHAAAALSTTRFHIPGSKVPAGPRSSRGAAIADGMDQETRHLLAAVSQKEPVSDVSNSDYASGRFGSTTVRGCAGNRDYASFYVRDPGPGQ